MDLKLETVARLSSGEAEELLGKWLAEEGRVTAGGWLEWASFTQWPDPLLLRLMAKLLVSELPVARLSRLTSGEVGIVGVGEVGLLLGAQVAFELAEQCFFDRAPSIIPVQIELQPHGLRRSHGEVELVTQKRIDGQRFGLEFISGLPGRERWLKTLLIVTDIMASGATATAARSLVANTFPAVKIEHLTGIRKVDQEKVLYRYELKEPVHSALELRRVEREDEESYWYRTRFLPPFSIPLR